MNRLVLLFYVLMMLLLAGATVLERLNGAEWIAENVYQSWWFAGLWAVLVVGGVRGILKGSVLRKNVGGLILHLALVLILTGAFLTKTTGQQGLVHLRVGEEGKSSLFLPFLIKLEKFEIPTYEGSDMPSDYISHIFISDEIGVRRGVVSMNNIFSHKRYRLYQSSFDEDGQGSWLSVNYDPYGIPVTYAGYVLLLVGFLWVLLRRCPKTTIAVVVIYAVIAILFTMRKEARAAEDFLLPVLRSPLIGWHVAAFIVGYTLLALMSLISVCALCVKRESALRRKFTEANRLLLYPSEMLLAIGIFVGAIWANLSWGRYWAWDPKEVWALITMMGYALPLHAVSLKWFRNDTFFHVFMIIAVLLALMTYFGVNMILGGIHSYGAD